MKWLLEYEAFHRKHRHSPNDRFLVYSCRAGMRDAPHCLGIGDRFRLIGFMLRVAAAHKRVLLIDWQSPEPLERFFKPHRIDWRLNAMERSAIDSLRVHGWRGRLHAPPAPVKYLRVVGNAPYDSTFPGDANVTAPYSTVWRFLFTPTVAMQRAVHLEREALFNHRWYVGLHVRMGDGAPGSAFARGSVPARDVRLSYQQAVGTLEYAQAQYPGTPVLLATDNGALKAAVRARKDCAVIVRGCTDCMINPVFLHNFSHESVVDIFMELLMLAQSYCFLHRSSNFAAVVSAMRGEGACDLTLQ